MPTVIHLPSDERTSAFSRGLDDGRAAKARNDALKPYLRIGIDEYAQGYRSGFFARRVVAASAKPEERTAGAS